MGSLLQAATDRHCQGLLRLACSAEDDVCVPGNIGAGVATTIVLLYGQVSFLGCSWFSYVCPMCSTVGMRLSKRGKLGCPEMKQTRKEISQGANMNLTLHDSPVPTCRAWTSEC